MHLPHLAVTTAILLSLAAALPLNINLGAYSPALVVGDGAIEFKGEAAGGNSVTRIVDALQGAAVAGAGGSNNNNAAAVVTPPGVQAAAVQVDQPAAAEGGILNDKVCSWSGSIALYATEYSAV